MSPKSDPAVLVTGATGFIGRHVVTRLLVAGRRVVILATRRRAEFAVVPGCGHGFFWQKPEEVNKIIRDWLDRH